MPFLETNSINETKNLNGSGDGARNDCKNQIKRIPVPSSRCFTTKTPTKNENVKRKIETALEQITITERTNIFKKRALTMLEIKPTRTPVKM